MAPDSHLQQPVHAQSAEAALVELGSDLRRGLEAGEVARRQERSGWNELPEVSGQPAWLKLLLQFNQPLIYILLVAGLIKALLAAWTNALVIWAVAGINAVIGYVQEARAEGAIAALARSVSTETTVLRDGQTLTIPSRELVPGDVVLLAAGDKVPADMRLLEQRDLQIDESGLTGEFLPVAKALEPLPADTPLADRLCMAYSGSFVTFGQGRGVVVATGEASEMGEISRSLQKRVSLSTPLTRRFASFSRVLLYFILAVAALTLAIGLGRGQPFAEVFEAAVALAVSAIPEGLPAVVTITLAIGVNRMAARHAIIRKLPAVEALGSATAISSMATAPWWIPCRRRWSSCCAAVCSATTPASSSSTAPGPWRGTPLRRPCWRQPRRVVSPGPGWNRLFRGSMRSPSPPNTSTWPASTTARSGCCR
jgi:cation-transporting ATPase F